MCGQKGSVVEDEDEDDEDNDDEDNDNNGCDAEED